MIKQNNYSWPSLLGIVLCWVIVAPLSADDSNDSLLKSMQERQSQLETELKNPSHCLGERLDGMLEINANCSVEGRKLAEAENLDRKALHKLMAGQLDITTDEVGQARAQRYLKLYNPGILRQVKLSSGKTTWWDGYPPHPDQTQVSRILALINARIYQTADTTSSVLKDNIQQYEAFGVVDSTTDGEGKQWYQVTEEYVPKIKPPSWSPNILGWISSSQSIPWRRALVMRFTNSYQRSPSLFFRDPDTAKEMSLSPINERSAKLKKIIDAITEGTTLETDVIAMEPLTNQKQAQAIIYPVLDYHSRKNGEKVRIDGKFTRLLEVAARTRSEGSGGYSDQDIPLDVLFVMDTTHSMKPYFEGTLAAVEEFATNGGNNNGIKFGFIGYQDKGAGFSYAVKEYTNKMQSTADFVKTLQNIEIRTSPVKGDDIPESVFEGIDTALLSGQWRKGSIKIIFLVGDAPGREDNLNLQVLSGKAFNRNINIFAFHISNSKVSKKYDVAAKEQYSILSSTYKGAQGEGEAQDHMLSIDAVAPQFQQSMLDSFNQAQQGFDAIQKCMDASCDHLPSDSGSGSLSNLIFRQAQLLMPDESLPDQEIQGWVFDKVLDAPDRQSLAPMILLTESELDELSQRVSELKEIGEQALRGEGGTTLDFFDLVSRNTRFTMVDPAAVNFRDAFSVPLGINELPYDSDIMATTRDEFSNMDQVQDFVRSISNKLHYYEDLRRQRGDPLIWKRLSTGASERDMVVAVELDYLP